MLFAPGGALGVTPAQVPLTVPVMSAVRMVTVTVRLAPGRIGPTSSHARVPPDTEVGGGTADRKER